MARTAELSGDIIQISARKHRALLRTKQLLKKKIRETVEKEHFYKALLEGIPDIVMRFDRNCRHIFVSKNVEEITGIPPSRFINKTHREMGFAETISAFWENAILQVFNTGRPYGTEFSLDGKQGLMTFDWRLMPEGDGHGRINSVITISRDITLRKNLEERIQTAQRLESIGTLAGGIAHDFNNNLGAILGYTEMALAELSEDSRCAYYLKNVLKAGEKAGELVNQILTFSRREDQELRPLKLSSVIKEAVKLLRPALPSFIEIKTEIEATGETVLADLTRMHQMIMNVCTNAAHAMREKGGILSIGLRREHVRPEINDPKHRELREGDYLVLTVKDTGHGIEKTVLPKIFDPFFTANSPGEGSGMGLAVTHGIVKNHDGVIWAESTPGRGTIFYIYLPLLEKNEPPVNAEAPSPPCGNGRILCVDDDEALAEVAGLMLTRLGYEVVTAASSSEALDIFKSSPQEFDLVLTDMTMPEMTGLALAMEIMNMKPDFPVVLATGFSELVDKREALETGIKDVVMKPYTTSELALAVSRALGG